MKLIKKIVKESNFLITNYRFLQSSRYYFRFKIVSFVKHLYSYIFDLIKIKKNKIYTFEYLYPNLSDKTFTTPLDIQYFYQDTWAAKKIFELKPKIHYDIGSSAKTIGILSQFVPITMVDIRPLPIKLNNFNFIKGSITSLPFKDNSIESISSLCVIEHIGLGRYGDEIDEFGSEKAIKEIKRVTKKNGIILISVPVFKKNAIFFNSHRAFTRDYILSLFSSCKLIEEKYIYYDKLENKYKPDFGTGLYIFKKY